jgi:hypothetical protein
LYVLATELSAKGRELEWVERKLDPHCSFRLGSYTAVEQLRSKRRHAASHPATQACAAVEHYD